MAVIAIGDFEDTQTVVELIRTHFGDKISEINLPSVPKFVVPSHEEPRMTCVVDPEADEYTVVINFKMPVYEVKTVKDYKNSLAQEMLIVALNRRFFKLSRRGDPPYVSCEASAYALVAPVEAFTMFSSCKEGRTVEALESMFTEFSSVRLHGFLEAEIAVARKLLMSNLESAYSECAQMHSICLRNEYMQHFPCDKPVLNTEFDIQLQTFIIQNMSANEVSEYAKSLTTSSSCVVKINEPQASARVVELNDVVSKINQLEEEGSIPLWIEENIPEEIIPRNMKPSAGAIELILSNGIRVCYKCTDFLADEGSHMVAYLKCQKGGIPRPHEPIFNVNRDDLKSLSCTFPSTIIREVVHNPMAEARCSVKLCFPLKIKKENEVDDKLIAEFLRELIERKLLHFLRFERGEVDKCTTMVELALDEISRLQKDGHLDEDISAILEIEQRAHENGLQENHYWLDSILRGYQSLTYSGDVGLSFEVQDEARSTIRESMTPLMAKLALQRILHFPDLYSVVILMPSTVTTGVAV